MALDKEWLGDYEPNIRDEIEGLKWVNVQDNPHQLLMICRDALREIRALDLRVKLYGKRIDELQLELDNNYWDEQDRA